ncbi:hypothetical protein QBC42DRAFT_345154 [Cladorrhinum samala]|uniref:Uncharacterized protein n=1 Tax=Cladorrhinum samala TaxID=585594 RepID=A0AAV9HU73_9PEZI|nr:hypothetical protein QBC42DRAFT_345154 [Cladorrhinum samala]
MRPSLIAFLSLMALSAALPLNINLGAYSPAVVVGDGAISFAKGGEVTKIIDSLEGAAVSGAAAASSSSSSSSQQQQQQQPAARQVEAAAVKEQEAKTKTPILNDPTAALPEPGDTRLSQLGPRSSLSIIPSPRT